MFRMNGQHESFIYVRVHGIDGLIYSMNGRQARHFPANLFHMK